MNDNDNLLIAAIELHLKGEPLDNESFNTMMEYAPIIAIKLVDSFRMTIPEFRKVLSERKFIHISDIVQVVLKTTFGEFAILAAKIILAHVEAEEIKSKGEKNDN